MWPWRRRQTSSDGSNRGEGTSARHVVDDRVFVLGLDELYRNAAKRCESTELLGCAQRVAAELRVLPATNVPTEGYYGESLELTHYFQLMRALQATPRVRAAEVHLLPEYQRLLQVASSPHLGSPAAADGLLPVARDSLSAALLATRPNWNVPDLLDAAAREAERADDCSLVGLAARTRDAVLLTAVRESVVLYAEVVLAIGLPDQREQEYVWRVHPELAALAQRFVSAVNALLHAELPSPDAASAEAYWGAYTRNDVVGRCVRLGYADRDRTVQNYHLVIKQNGDALEMEDFWDVRHWTTTLYRHPSAAQASLRSGFGNP
jgi:hypothetical protein